ncbi:hypothetical protein CFE70_004916 [Pyrenophora teres f. teres 0-1]
MEIMHSVEPHAARVAQSLLQYIVPRYATALIALGITLMAWWVVSELVATTRLRRIPRVGKTAGFWGLDLRVVKKDFAKNGRKILYDGYMKSSSDALIEPLNKEATYWLSKRVPEKTELRAYETMVRIISSTASLMLGGKAMSRNEEWLETAAEYSMDVVSVAMKLRPWPAFIRPLIFPWLRGAKLLQKHLAITKKYFKPIFEERLADLQKGNQSKKPIDMVQWMAESAKGSDRNPDVLAHNMLFMALAGVHTSSATAIHVLFDLCAHPEFITPLRDEIERTVREYGWSLSSINCLKRLDSFMKESQRLNQAVLITKTLRLRDGTVIPKGTYLTMPADAVARDPEIYPDPEHFDGLRFYDKRMSTKAEANRHQFATINPESLAFGQGKQACPGRFFAGAQIKAVIANILLNYDISFPPGQTTRPQNIYKGGLVRPDPRQKLVFVPRE